VLDAEWLGDPDRLTDPVDLAEIQRIRWALGGRFSQPLRHLGEASTIVLARRESAVAVLDDRDARRLAGALTIRFTGTLGIIRASTRDGLLDADEPWAIVQTMRTQRFRMPPGVERDWFR
jgi:predicted nucleic acid-binding protein